ncbi:hypothetical protein ABOM_009856 [Aspergillus bombycis]|uniref:MACPF domain-containing protein n=1 Tax=Aspergillus bombycis TaxID=109264 RepID=A0A1F7ZNX4_9EURO|nr:hypothetical protein ABOM_009856 [Aspergillus bombycis]OGM41150.1 hypothetical protein ABOM_009856 [Aspergillus bombycis]
MTASHLFNIKTVDKAGEAKLTNVINIEKDIDEITTLQGIRQLLVSAKKLDSAKARFAFCGKDGARVGDDFNWKLYEALVAEGSDQDSKTQLPGDTKVHNLCFESPEETSKEKSLSKQAQDLLDSKLDMDLVKNKPELVTATLKELASTYNHANFKAAAGGNVVTASSLSQEDWETVLRNTHYLNAHRVVFSNLENGTRAFKRLDKAPFAAFCTAPRKIFSLEKADKSIQVEGEYRIPRYVVTDDSYVNVFETASSLSESVASSSFSQMDIEASAGGSLFGASLSVKAGFSQNESQAVATSTSKSARSMNITYNFPRAILHLDARSLELTEECKIALQGVKDADSLIQFHQDFGHFFATNVELGGKLFASEQFTSEESAKAEEKANAMKASASASFSYGAFSASASYSQENQQSESRNASSSQMTNNLTWEARGGDTILCNDPPNWCATVKPFTNWRIINQRDVMPLGDLIGTFQNYKHIPSDFDQIRKGSRQSVPCRFRLRANKKDDVGDNEFYGVRRREDGKKKLEPYLRRHKGQLLKDDGLTDDTQIFPGLGFTAYWQVSTPSGKFYSAFEERVKKDYFTDNFKEYVGIDKLDHHNGGCDFEVEVVTELKAKPKLQLNVPYLIHVPKRSTYLAADTSGTYKDRFFGYMFYARQDRASKFMFRKVGDRDRTGAVEDKMEVELAWCNDDGEPVAVVQRFEADQSTLVLSKYGASNASSYSVEHNATVEYS